ncbi:MAG: M48 family metalloprotease, partial [Thermoanaerobaculia bacterium]
MKRAAAVCLAGSLALSSARVPAQDVLNPDVFYKSAEAARQAMTYYGAYDDPEELERLQALGYQLAQQTSFKHYPFSFFLVDMPVPNAFALPGGQIFVTRGMLDLGLSNDMLAGLLGHEIGHVVLQHGTKLQRRATLLNVLSQALLVGVAVTASNGSRDTGPAPPTPYGTESGSGDRVMGAAAAGIVVSELLLRSYSREFEDQADDEGVRMAAGAGFDPAGFEQLMSLMQARLPQSKEYGYWNTHPFFDSRLRAASVRGDLLRVQEAENADDYREKTQARLLGLVEGRKVTEEVAEFLEDAAVNAWPRSDQAHGIRLARLHAARDLELENHALARDYGELLERYQAELERAREFEASASHTDSLQKEIEDFEQSLADLYPKALETFGGGVFETDFLETFVSNYSDSEVIAEVSLALGEAYSRLRRPEDAVSMFLRAWRSAPESDAGKRAERGLLVLTPTLEELGALQELADQAEDPELRSLAVDRLSTLSGSFETLANGAGFLKRFPDSEFSEAVTERLNQLAEGLYGEAILYQNIGDHA